MTPAEQLDRVRTHGISYDRFLDQWRARLDAPMAGLSPDERKYQMYRKYNRTRSEAVHAAYTPSERMQAAVDGISAPLTVAVITEDWCGDSSFELPVIAEALRDAPNVTLRILPRDEHLDVMDEHLTSGGRSIPKVVAYRENGDIAFTWGPRPDSGMARREELKAQGLDYARIAAEMVKWYEEGHWIDVDADFAQKLEGVE